MLELVGSFSSDGLQDEVPPADSLLLLLLIELVLVLETIIGEMNHQVLLILNVLFRVVLDSESEISWVEKGDAWVRVEEKEASDVKFLRVEQ